VRTVIPVSLETQILMRQSMLQCVLRRCSVSCVKACCSVCAYSETSQPRTTGSNVLQYVAVYCSMLQYVAGRTAPLVSHEPQILMCCSMLQCVVVCHTASNCNTLHQRRATLKTQILLLKTSMEDTEVSLQRTAKKELQSTVKHCSTLQHIAAHCTTLQHTTHCNTEPHSRHRYCS